MGEARIAIEDILSGASMEEAKAATSAVPTKSPWIRSGIGSSWDITGDGQRFLFSVPTLAGEGAKQPPLIWVLNWASSLK